MSSSADAQPGAQPALLREMGRWTLTAAVINNVVGSGIFGLPSTLAALAGPWSPLLVIAAGACIFTVILCFAEVGSRFDQAGGPRANIPRKPSTLSSKHLQRSARFEQAQHCTHSRQFVGRGV